ncbi:hypothetical protein [Pseudomonas coronafaciens]|uniref:hypothetical protein n=1 Tax=Pseudomonas coronafaciens TaxID=53409 RepID=UPI000EFF4DBF|nr:hypothetical protein [Pseudomonas coronafaciens]
MKIIGRAEVETVLDVKCDVCDSSTAVSQAGWQFGTLLAHWGYGSTHDGERYEVHLCEGCFFQALAYLRQERRTQHMFSSESQSSPAEFGLVGRDDYFNDAGR